MPNNFGEDLAFIKRFFSTQVLSNSDGATLFCVAELQGRTMTSSSNGNEGVSYGYINYANVEKGLVDPQINLVGGEDRIWISPEGGQYSVFFEPGSKDMDFASWRTPPCIDSEPFELIDTQADSLTYQKHSSVTNMSGFTFEFTLERKVTLLSRNAVVDGLETDIPDSIQLAGYVSDNKITNTSDTPWVHETGLIGLWAICMNPPAPNAVLMVPYKKGDDAELGQIVTADYFGKLSGDRLKVDEELGLVFLRGDGDFRSKLGISHPRASSRLGSWNPETGVLSVVDFNLPESAPAGYTNNLWIHQDDPFKGDVINAYNDGPNDSGGKLGGFFELETISPALPLKKDESYTHTTRIVRFEGARDQLDQMAQTLFGANLTQIESALDKIAAS